MLDGQFLLFTKFFASLVSRIVGLFYTTRLTSDANDFVNAKSHAREKPLFAGRSVGLLNHLTCAVLKLMN